MGRPRTNHSNWWRGENEEIERQAMAVLTATAQATLRQMDPGRSNFVEVGDLISEGWLRSMRYARQLEKWEPLHCMKHMREEYLRLRFRSYSASYNHQHPTLRISDDYPLIYHRSQWGVRCLDIWDMVQVRCTPRQRRVVLHRWRGYSRTEIARRLGLSGESVRLERVHIRGLLRDAI